ncbi:hypothetical protein B0T16DRAFT_53493 [Cercophora newfieldiana]|uniref:Uncharacterized protein n=1 Tax=Cercophora newfieldiana TaxID=92897 RepID=A0AA40CZG3_9PEZI|nr:hypothetical protein B0T16DRAFT_53493 [Cercophora newfieldiana]
MPSPAQNFMRLVSPHAPVFVPPRRERWCARIDEQLLPEFHAPKLSAGFPNHQAAERDRAGEVRAYHRNLDSTLWEHRACSLVVQMCQGLVTGK